MPNPLFQNSKGQDVNTPINRVDDVNKTYNQHYNNFNLSRPHATSLSFADVTPFEGVDCIGEDKIKFGSSHKLRSYTLSSPLMDDIYMKKSYYALDMRSILPLNWDIIYREPSVGDDIPNDNVNTVFDPTKFLSDFLYAMVDDMETAGDVLEREPSRLDYYIKSVILLELLLSDSSLLSRFGIHLGSKYKLPITTYNPGGPYVDHLFEKFYSDLKDYSKADSEFFLYDRERSTYFKCSFVEGLELLRSYPTRFTITKETIDNFVSLRTTFDLFFSTLRAGLLISENDSKINFSKVVAYQLVCAEYFTNDKVDNIYSSEVYIKNMRGLSSYLFNHYDSIDIPSFNYNGIPYLYDACSGFVVDKIFEYLTNQAVETFTHSADVIYKTFGYLFNLFGIRKSLRFGDYFLGSRTEPYAPHVDMTAEVHNGSVSAIDTTRSILAQRFANSVARTKRKFSDYLANVVGGYDVPDVELPRWLASTTSKVSGFEVENTSSNQGDIVTVLNTSGSDFIYELEVGSPTIVIGVCTFFMTRFYDSGIDRFAYHYNRYDMFNKFMQYEGDQSIKSAELDGFFVGDFSYQIRHSEYKMRYPICSGAWKTFLPSMFMKAGVISDHYDSDTGLHLDSFNIRSLNIELDPFYRSLTYYSLCGRYHFQAIFFNNVDADRRMAVSPQIL